MYDVRAVAENRTRVNRRGRLTRMLEAMLGGRGAGGDYDDDVVVYWYSFSNHYTKRAFTQPQLCGRH